MLSRFIHIRLFATPWTVAHQAPLSRQEYWSGLPRPPPGDLPNSGIEPGPLMSPALAGGFFTTSATWEAWQCGLGRVISLFWASVFLAVTWDHSDAHLVGPSKESVGRRLVWTCRRPLTRYCGRRQGWQGPCPQEHTAHRQLTTGHRGGGGEAWRTLEPGDPVSRLSEATALPWPSRTIN